MRYRRFLLFSLGLCLCALTAAAVPKVTIQSVGCNGYYRTGMLFPVYVLVENSDKAVKGELRLNTMAYQRSGPNLYRFPVTIPAGAKQLHTLYMSTPIFSRNIKVEFVQGNTTVTINEFRDCQEVGARERLMVVIGGDGSALSYLNGQTISSAATAPVPRPCDMDHFFSWRREEQVARLQMRRNSSPSPSPSVPASTPPGVSSTSPPPPIISSTPTAPSGILRVVNMDAAYLPDNPEAYSSISCIALMSDVTENSLRDKTGAITVWVLSGGHLIIAGGGVPSRLESPFFTQFRGQHSTTTGSGTLQAETYAKNLGWASFFAFDPEATPNSEWKTVGNIYSELAARQAQLHITLPMSQLLEAAIRMRNLKPPKMSLVLGFLFGYILILSPVNYFVMKKLDKRELSWITSLCIIAVFTVGAYGIGAMSKGHRLIVNTVSVIETSAGDQVAEAVSRSLVFSPSQSKYQVNLGETALFARESNQRYYENYSYNSPDSYKPLSYVTKGRSLFLDPLHIDMWAARQLLMIHRMDLGQGISVVSDEGVVKQIINQTPYHFDYCRIISNGDSDDRPFAMNPRQAVDIGEYQTVNGSLTKYSKDEKEIFSDIEAGLYQGIHDITEKQNGDYLIAYTRDKRARVPMRVNGQASTNTITVFVVHLSDIVNSEGSNQLPVEQ